MKIGDPSQADIKEFLKLGSVVALGNSTADYLYQNGVLPQNIMKVLMYTFKCLHDKAPPYLSDLISVRQQKRALRSADVVSLTPPKARTKYGERHFGYTAAKLWNELPKAIRQAQTIDTFKKQLKTHLFREHFNLVQRL